MTPTTIAILVFAAVVLAAFMVYSLLRDIAKSDSRRVKKRIEEEFGGTPTATRLFQNLSNAAQGFQDTEEEKGLWKSFQLTVEQSGLSLDARGVLLRSLGVAVTLFVMALVLTRSIFLSATLAVIGFAVPVIYVMYKRDQRLEALRGQLADVYSMMSRVMQAGQTSAQAMQLVAQEFSDPVAGEFSYCTEQQNVGLPQEISLRELARRTGILEIKMYVVAALVHREAGGSLAEVLDNLSRVIRERFRVRGQVRTLTAEGRFQAAILLALPLFLFGAMYLMNQEYMSILFKYPELIAAAFASELMGAVWIRKIINIDF